MYPFIRLYYHIKSFLSIVIEKKAAINLFWYNCLNIAKSYEI